MTRRNSKGGWLTALQQAILDILTSHGPSTAEAVREALHPKHRLKDSSVRTLLRRLESRGLVSHRTDGKVFIYEAQTTPSRLAAKTIRHLIDGVWAGSVEQFLVGMVEERVITRAELDRLAKKVRGRS